MGAGRGRSRRTQRVFQHEGDLITRCQGQRGELEEGMWQLGDPVVFTSPDRENQDEQAFAIFSDGVALRLVRVGGKYQAESVEHVGDLAVESIGTRHEFGDSLSGLETSFRRVKKESDQEVERYEREGWRNRGGTRGWSTQYLWEELRITRRQNNVCAGAAPDAELQSVSF